MIEEFIIYVQAYFDLGYKKNIGNYRVSHSEMNDSKWLLGVEALRIFLNYGG